MNEPHELGAAEDGVRAWEDILAARIAAAAAAAAATDGIAALRCKLADAVRERETLAGEPAEVVRAVRAGYAARIADHRLFEAMRTDRWSGRSMSETQEWTLEASQDVLRSWEGMLIARIYAAEAAGRDGAADALWEALYATVRERRDLLGHTPEAIDAITAAYSARIRAARESAESR